MTLPVDYIERTRAQYEHLGYPPYTWVRNSEQPPFVPLRKPIAESRIGLVASGGIYSVGQVAFHFKDDFSFRLIPQKTPLTDLRVTHFAYDVTDARSDPNVVFPQQTLVELARSGAIGELNDNAYTILGGIYSSRKVTHRLAPALVERLIKDEVDVVVLVPV